MGWEPLIPVRVSWSGVGTTEGKLEWGGNLSG